MGPSRRFDDVRAISVLPLITDLRQRDRHVRFVPEPDLPLSALLTRLGQRAVRVREHDPGVDINGLPIHLALPLGEKAPIGQKFSSRPVSPCGRARCRRSG
jgi:hypothetical protein